MFTGYESTEEVTRAVNTAASYFSSILPGEVSRPGVYSVFPEGDVVEGSDSKQSESFLGYVFMENVYTQKYVFGEDTVTLFSTSDPAGAKFLSWRNELDQEGLSDESLAGLRYDDNMALKFEHAYYGQVVAGLTAGELVGAIGYTEKYADFMAEWIMSLKNPMK
jgi:hypothetical protein